VEAAKNKNPESDLDTAQLILDDYLKSYNDYLPPILELVRPGAYRSMVDTLYEYKDGDFLVSTDVKRLQVDAIQDFLSQAYWAQGRPRGTIVRSISNSLCFGLYTGEDQVGFARVVTDYATYAWLCDVFIRKDYRGRGLGKMLLGSIMAHPELQHLRRWSLATSDAHGLYRQFGFSGLAEPEKLMELFNRQPYATEIEELG